MESGPLPCVFTIGHSTRPLEGFTAILQAFEIRTLADIRSYPGSRRYPHFNRENLAAALTGTGVAYVWLKTLGGRRRSDLADSPNTGLRHTSFRAYADYMMCAEFRSGIVDLLTLTAAARTAIMCSEAVYWRCHRRLVSDYLITHGVEVRHIMGPGSLRPHKLTEGAELTPDGLLVYRPPQPQDGQEQLF